MIPLTRWAYWLPRILKVAPWIAVGLLLAAAVVQKREVIAQRERIVFVERERDRFVDAVTEATVPPDAQGQRARLTPDEALAAARGLARDRDDARAALARIDREARAARSRTTAADAYLRQVQGVNARAYARAAPEIARLEAARATGSAARDAAAIETDSKAAWEAWR